MSRKPPPPPKPTAKPRKPPAPVAAIDPLARMLATTVRTGHGIDQATTLDMSESLGEPRVYIGTRNIALERALGVPGVPAGRITEVSGWEGAGKSTILDQIFAQCQADGGLGVIADTERTRKRNYMMTLGVRPESLVWIGGQTVEVMFDQIETLVRNAAHLNATAWFEALVRAGFKCSKPQTYTHKVYEPHVKVDAKTKPVAQFAFNRWGREQAAALLQYQKANGLPESSVRDPESREALRPCVVFGDDPQERSAALKAWLDDGEHPLVQLADRPIVVGWDSVAGTPTEEELAGNARAMHVASSAKVIRRNLRRLVQLIDDEAIAFVLVNQRYERIQTGGMPMRGPKSETYGGGGIKYHSTIRIEVDKVGNIMAPGYSQGDPPMGQIVKIKVPKNKVNDPYHTEEFGLIFGRGADNAWAIFEDLKNRGIVRVSGGWSRFTDPSILGAADKSFRGWTELSNMMAEDPALWAKLKAIYHEGR